VTGSGGDDLGSQRDYSGPGLSAERRHSFQQRAGSRRRARCSASGAAARFPFIETIFADAGYQRPKMAKTVAPTGAWRIVIVKRFDAHRFVILPKRWIVERTLAWNSRNRRLARDFIGS
jgi:putative transposase